MDDSPEAVPHEAVEIRLAQPLDHAAIKDLFRHGLIDGNVDGNDTGADIDDLEAGYFSDEGNSAFWVASYEGDVAGMIGVQRTGEDSAEVRRLRVRDRHRRRGIGTRLIQQAIGFCRDHGYLRVSLDVRIERGPAIGLFEQFGFVPGRIRDVAGRKTIDFYLDLYRDLGGSGPAGVPIPSV